MGVGVCLVGVWAPQRLVTGRDAPKALAAVSTAADFSDLGTA